MVMTRRNLPHLHFESGFYFLTFRLAGTLPTGCIEQLNRNGANFRIEEVRSKKMFVKFDDILDQGRYGPHHLKDDRLAEVVKYCMHFPDGSEYKLICYTVMSNHVHQVFELLKGNKGLNRIMQSIKGVSARRSNKILNRKGRFWQDESFDRCIRDKNELIPIVNYVLQNPVKAGLVQCWKDWKHSYCHPDFEDAIDTDP